MGDLSKGQFFSVEDGVLQYVFSPIQEQQVREAEEILQKHVIPRRNKRFLYRSLLFCIASQRTEYERAIAFTKSLSNATVKELQDPVFLAHYAKASQLLHSNNPYKVNGSNSRFKPALQLIEKLGGIERVTHELLANPFEMRETLARENGFLAPKTASFWHLSLGGHELMTLDTHNYRQIAGIGVRVPASHYDGRLRADGRNVNTTAGIKEYRRIEAETLDVLSCCDLLKRDGRVDAALATAVFWITGAKVRRGENPEQRSFLEWRTLPFESPY